ncbi:MAG: hypothetical protein ACOX3T_03800 [Bdellovibrionota bacterium]
MSGCLCPSGYVCMLDPSGENDPSGGENNGCCDKENGEPGDSCCKEDNYFEGNNDEKLCCEDGQTAGYVIDVYDNKSFVCDSECPEDSVGNETGEIIEDEGESYPKTVCCPDNSPKFTGYNMQGDEVCCDDQEELLCRAACCEKDQYCTDIKGTIRSFKVGINEETGEIEFERLAVQTCCGKEGQVHCGGACCDANKCARLVSEREEKPGNYSSDFAASAYLCCGDGKVYNKEDDGTQACCDGEVYEKPEGGSQGCCANPNSWHFGRNVNSSTGEYLEVCCNPLAEENSGGMCGDFCCKNNEHCAYSNWDTKEFACCPTNVDYNEYLGQCCSVDAPNYTETKNQGSNYGAGGACCPGELDIMCGGEGQCCPVNRCIGEGGGARCGCSSDETEYTDSSGKKACCKTGRIYNEQYCCSQDLCNGVCCEDGKECKNNVCEDIHPGCIREDCDANSCSKHNTQYKYYLCQYDNKYCCGFGSCYSEGMSCFYEGDNFQGGTICCEGLTCELCVGASCNGATRTCQRK